MDTGVCEFNTIASGRRMNNSRGPARAWCARVGAVTSHLTSATQPTTVGAHSPWQTPAGGCSVTGGSNASGAASAPNWNWASVAEAGELFRSGACTPTDLLDACFARIDATESIYHSFVFETRTAAVAAAKASTERFRSGTPRSALDGIPIGLKDIYDTAGVCTAGGCYAYRHRVPVEDCAVVAKLKAAGAVLVGKTFTVELASGGLLNPQYRDEVTTNPWDATRQPGGSSSGSAAAVAGGQVIIATGSCTGGSIRSPAAYCGVTGFVSVSYHRDSSPS